MPRILTKLKITEVSAVDRGAGEGVRVLLMKRDDTGRSFNDFMKADVVDDGGGDTGDRSDQNNTSLADHPVALIGRLLVASGSQPNLASAVHYLLNTSHGAALLHRTRTHKGVDPMQDSIHAIMKSAGIAGVCAAIVQKGTTSFTEAELVEAVGKIAVERFPQLSEAQAFSRVYTAGTDEARVLQHALSVAKAAEFSMVQPTMVGGPDAMHEANDSTESSEAYAQLEAMAQKMRMASPELSAAQAFAKVFTDKRNAALAAKAHVRPRPTTSYQMPR
jgi:hypothetical protein